MRSEGMLPASEDVSSTGGFCSDNEVGGLMSRLADGDRLMEAVWMVSATWMAGSVILNVLMLWQLRAGLDG